MDALVHFNCAEIGRRLGCSRQFVNAVFRGKHKMPEKMSEKLVEMGVLTKRVRHAKA